jgi:hypothetical protein
MPPPVFAEGKGLLFFWGGSWRSGVAARCGAQNPIKAPADGAESI